MADDTVTAVCLNPPKIVANNSDFELANELTFDFYCLRFWEEFKEKSTVDERSDRNFLQGLLGQKFTYTTQRENLVHFMQLIVCLADGQDAATRYSTTPGEEDTPLEKAISLFDELVAEHEDLGEEVEAVREAFKIQAVMVCMRANDYGLAKMVHQRVWGKSCKSTRQTKQPVMQSVLKLFIDDEKVKPDFLDRHTYESFLQIAKALLQKVYDKYDTPFLLKVFQAYRRSVERRLQVLENNTEDVSSVEMSSSKQPSETSSPIKGFRRSERLSDELHSKPVTADKDIPTAGDIHKVGRCNHPAHVARVDGDEDGCHDNQKDQASSEKDHDNHCLDVDNDDHGNQRTEHKAKGKGIKRKLPVVSSDSEDENADSCQEKNKEVARTTSKGKGIKRKLPVVSPDSEDESVDSCQEKNKEVATTTSPSHIGNGSFTKGEFYSHLQTFEAVLQSLVGPTEVTDITSKPLVVPRTLQQHNLRSRRKAHVKTPPSILKSPPTKTSTPAPSPGQVRPTPSPTKKSKAAQAPGQVQPKPSPTKPSTPAPAPGRVQPTPSPTKTSTQAPAPGRVQPKPSPTKTSAPVPAQGQVQPTPSPTKTTPAKAPSRLESTPQNGTSDGREHNSPHKKSEGNFIKFQKTTPKRGKSIRDKKYQPNRVKEISPDVPSTSKGNTSPYSMSEDDSDTSISPPVLHSPRVRRSLDPDTWNGNATLRKLPNRRKPWTEDEVDLLKKAIRRYGVGRWSEMIVSYDFNGRTNVNLKDKWRTMVKNGEI
ncbi:telomeric repeat-binding factor 2-like isoform X2 [Patiria miniata]|uniref:Uncharacterized protein n=1 Tax=Patiria miniata TaxID=46514 RepID=A0A914BKW1_PATMI|nr:telomeric repeat-binding factor 2-like isoform X2 [Patiria miniata]